MISALYTTVGKNQVIKKEMIVIGKGASSKVFSGRFDNMDVAVKRVDIDEYSKKELDLIRVFDHENIVRYLYKDFDHEYLYIVMEKCDCTLQEFIEDASFKKKKYISRIEMLRQTTIGLTYLHDSQNIIHLDLKPSNVLLLLIGQKWVVRIADFGLSKQLPKDRSKLTQTNRRGAVGYNAPEVLKQEQVSKKSDIFSLGILYYFTLSGGEHPYGKDILKLEAQIRDGEQPTMEHLDKKYADDAKILILSMIAYKWEDRFDIEQVQSHYLLWNNEKKLDFIQDVSDYAIAKTTSKVISAKLNENSEPVIGKSWRASVYAESPVIKEVLEEMRLKIHGNDIMSLLGNIRNLKKHFEEKPTEFKKMMANGGSLNNMEFFFKMFPALISHVYKVMRSVERENPIFKNLFYAKKEPRPVMQSPERQISFKQDASGRTVNNYFNVNAGVVFQGDHVTAHVVDSNMIIGGSHDTEHRVLTGTTADESLATTSKAMTELSITEKVNVIIMFNEPDNHMFSYRPSTKEWSLMQGPPEHDSSKPFTTVGLIKHIYFIQKQKVYQLEYSNPAAEWKEMSGLKENHGWDPRVAIWNGFIYACGSAFGAELSRSVERYDAALDRWDHKCDMNIKRKSPCIVATEEYIWSFGGWEEQEGKFALVERFDERLNKWEAVESAPKPIIGATAAVVKNRIYFTSFNYDGVLCYDIQNNKWSWIDLMTQWPFSRFTMGKILVVDDKLYTIGIIGELDRKYKFAIYLLEPDTKQMTLVEEVDDKRTNPQYCLAVKL